MTRRVRVTLDVEVSDELSDEEAKRVAVWDVIQAARESVGKFESLVALVDPQ
jgi:hypothetical protein